MTVESILNEIAERVRRAMQAIGVEGDPRVGPSAEDKPGDYQSNCAMGLAKQLGRNPREMAQALVERLDLGDLCEPPDVAGPGFINFRLAPKGLARRLQEIPPVPMEGMDRPGRPASVPMEGTDRLGLERSAAPQTVVVDFSSPNLAKEMHVGHLRSTVIGDCVCRVLEFQGHAVHRENHVGDWGTQFGMLVTYLRRTRPDALRRLDDLVITDLEAFYIQAKALFDEDDAFKKEAQETVVALQRGDAATRDIWKAFCEESLRHCHDNYKRLNVILHDRGESFYNDMMPPLIDRLVEQGHAVESEGALCVFLEGVTTREGAPLPFMVRKSDGGYNYAASDLAAVDFRVRTLKANRLIYVVGAPQKLHLSMLFAAARKTGVADDSVEMVHLAFGSVLSASGAPFKTREGGTVKLKDLLDQAVEKARAVFTTAPSDEEGEASDAVVAREKFTPDQIDRIAETVGTAAVKYFDLSHNLNKDYRFDLETMTALDGNTAPYLLYAYARIQAIGRKAGVDFARLPTDAPLLLEHEREIDLAKRILKLPEVLEAAGRELKPNLLTDYLYNLSKTFSRFYDRKLGVRVIDAHPDAVRLSRLKLCALTARALKLTLSLLGVDTLDQM